MRVLLFVWSSVENRPPAICEPVALKRIIRQRQALRAPAGFPWDRATLSPVTCGTSCWRALYTNDLSFATIFVAVGKYFAGLRSFAQDECRGSYSHPASAG